jgi:hypothetical protein
VSEQGDSARPDDGPAIHYLAVERGTPVYSAEGAEVGRVEKILDNAREHIFDGVVFRASDGGLRFADAPEVARTAERGVTLALSAEEALRLEPPEHRAALPTPDLGNAAGVLGRLFGRRRG